MAKASPGHVIEVSVMDTELMKDVLKALAVAVASLQRICDDELPATAPGWGKASSYRSIASSALRSVEELVGEAIVDD
jgi:hypothetical protein